jgi:cysteine desulfurase
MVSTPVYMDNHATTRVDPAVVDAMLPYLSEQYGNAASTSHVFGWDARDVVEQSRVNMAAALGVTQRELVFTSGATESNNLALRGACRRLARKGKHLVTVVTEHRAVLDPLARLAREGFEVTRLAVRQHPDGNAGVIDLDQLTDVLREDTVMVSVMMANNEIGVLQPIADVGAICKQREILLHTDATQAVGRVPVDFDGMGIDLASFSAHKFYGPKGVGCLYVRRRNPQVRLEAILDGGGHEQGRRSGTLNVPGIIGMARALELSVQAIDDETLRLTGLRKELYDQLVTGLDRVTLNEPALDGERLAGNLNLSFSDVDGEALMMSMRELAVSSGSACTSAEPEPSHVLRAIGRSDDETRASLRFGLGRFNTSEEVGFAANCVIDAVNRLRHMRA